MSRPPRVLLDCDGILANFIDATLLHIEALSDKKYTHDDITTWDVFRSLPEVAHLERTVYDKLGAPGGCSSIPVYPGAVAGVRELELAGAEVCIVTAPFPGSETWVYERDRWLQEHFSISTNEILHVRRKELVCGDIFIDDRASNVEDWLEEHPTKIGLLWDRPYNRTSTLPRVKSWEGVLSRVNILLALYDF